MYTELDMNQKNRLQTLKQLYIGKCMQLSKADSALNDLKYQILQAELHFIKAAIPENELPVFAES